MDAKVELLHIHLPGDVANADSALYVYVSKQINETSVKSSVIQSFFTCFTIIRLDWLSHIINLSLQTVPIQCLCISLP